jgi:uncharacterized membrane protein (DUF485 family)
METFVKILGVVAFVVLVATICQWAGVWSRAVVIHGWSITIGLMAAVIALIVGWRAVA